MNRDLPDLAGQGARVIHQRSCRKMPPAFLPRSARRWHSRASQIPWPISCLWDWICLRLPVCSTLARLIRRSLTNPVFALSIEAMRKLQVLVAMLLGVCWIPATSYCLLERAGIVQCGACCTGEGDDCCGDNCAFACSLPASTIPKTSASLEKAALALVPTAETRRLEIVAAGNAVIGLLSQSPPGSFILAEFLGRTATPARAPAIV